MSLWSAYDSATKFSLRVLTSATVSGILLGLRTDPDEDVSVDGGPMYPN
jgi:hypothetical protein